MERVLKILLILLVASANLLAAVSPEPIRIPLSATTISLNSSGVQDDSSLWVSRQVNCQLVRFHSGNLELEAAKQIKFRNPTTIEVTLRDDIKFHDGSIIQADDVIATLDYLEKSRNIFRNVFGWISKIQKADAHRVLIFLKHPVPHFLKVLSAPNYAIFKKAFLEEARKNPELWKNPIGCGKYKIASQNSAALRLEPVGAGLPIEFSLMAKNELSASESEKFDLFSLAVSNGAVPADKFQAESFLDPGQFYLGLNTRLPRWKKREDRCRFFSRLDSKDIVAEYRDVDGERATDLFPRGVIGYSSTVDYPKELSTWREKGNSDLGKNFCLMFHSSSVAAKYRPAYVGMLNQTFSTVSTKLLPSSVRFGEEFLQSGCDGLLIGFKSNYLDGYEFLLLFSEQDANFTGYWNQQLINEIKGSQNFDNSKYKFDAYQAIAAQLRKECVLFPLLTLPMRKVYVKKGLKAPGIGVTAINDYFLGQVER